MVAFILILFIYIIYPNKNSFDKYEKWRKTLIFGDKDL